VPACWRLISAKPENMPKAQKAWGLRRSATAWRTIPSPPPARGIPLIFRAILR
jgi:hypothetical protein